MTHLELMNALRQTLEDARMSRGERQALADLLSEVGATQAERVALRAKVFDMVRDTLSGDLDPAERLDLLDWLEAAVRLLDRQPASSRPERAPSEAWFSPGEEALTCIVRELRSVRAHADICVFTITDDRISDGILSAARRGVGVRLISDDDKAGDLGSDLRRFRRAGIPTVMDATDAHMHHKFAVFDRRRLLTGSFNWTRAATAVNHENVLVTEDPLLVRAYHREFEKLWSRLRGA